jgi:hypothetical protein
VINEGAIQVVLLLSAGKPKLALHDFLTQQLVIERLILLRVLVLETCAHGLSPEELLLPDVREEVIGIHS